MNNTWNEFFTKFKFDKVTYCTPGRDWDDEGLASWYEEESWPYITGQTLWNFYFYIKEREHDFTLHGLTQIDVEQEILNKLMEILERHENIQSIIIQDVQNLFEEE